MSIKRYLEELKIEAVKQIAERRNLISEVQAEPRRFKAELKRVTVERSS